MASSLSTHVLDAVEGVPAPGIQVEVLTQTGAGSDWESIGSGVTDDDGRIPRLVPDGLPAGTFRIVFATGAYFERAGVRAFYPEVAITFVVDEERHYHVPLLLSPFAYSTYRGS
ncbi:5-hydroxyisourate hydrolase [Rudaeicoccus suwonensis]|uniref:5-hydroxyisourate hydrolase n=2 Tax=Rudaeicoccus suwonensis TaxID=657409 RepID=A0A561E9X8_9MICO|nr:hydroxyisourate hydrolase [Rudaeicoccus suwonensis]TWE12415.1 5-hydroxyisourate hydrolase [Rudaeicoccus suwonensis]